MNVLRDLRELKAVNGASIHEITECNICGASSGSRSLSNASGFMHQHLCSHSLHELYSCTICGYGSGYRQRVAHHIKMKHPETNGGKVWEFWLNDHRTEFDEYLCKLSIKLYSNNEYNAVVTASGE